MSCGHGRKSLADAAARQMETMAFCSSYNGSSNQPASDLAERLADLCYPQINNFYFTSGGGEATDSNFKLARSYWKLKGKPDKTRVIARNWGYHGVTFAAMCATGIPPYWAAFEPRIPGFSHIAAPDPYHYPMPGDGSSQGIAMANELEQEICAWAPIRSRCSLPSRYRVRAASSFRRMTTSRAFAKFATSTKYCSWPTR